MALAARWLCEASEFRGSLPLKANCCDGQDFQLSSPGLRAMQRQDEGTDISDASLMPAPQLQDAAPCSIDTAGSLTEGWLALHPESIADVCSRTSSP